MFRFNYDDNLVFSFKKQDSSIILKLYIPENRRKYDNMDPETSSTMPSAELFDPIHQNNEL